MIELRPFATLGAARHGWLDAHHHFSFADYREPARTRWGRLRVWNDDSIAPHSGFAPHSHSDMEIITYVRNGAITHEDSLGNSGRTVAGDVQVMSAGSGIEHAEWNREDVETTLFQIWIFPDETGVTPRWETRPFPQEARAGQLVLLASGMEEDAGQDALALHAKARVLGARLRAGERVVHMLAPGRHAYLVPAAGKVQLGDVVAQARDGVAIADEERIEIVALEDSELVLVDTR